MTSPSRSRSLLPEVSREVDALGYFPRLVMATLADALGAEDVVAFVASSEPTFSNDEIRRHLTLVAATPTRLIVVHTDEQPSQTRPGRSQATSSAEVVGLGRIDNVVVTRVVDEAETWAPGAAIGELWLLVNWGATHRVELAPDACEDPQCTADHTGGQIGTTSNEDLTLRISVDADGPAVVQRALELGSYLQRAIASR